MKQMDEIRAEEILRALQETFELPNWRTYCRDPFRTLIATIISQNTAERNMKEALEKLSLLFQITPQSLAKAEIGRIEECLKVAGLYRNKAKTIRNVSRIIAEKFQSDLAPIFLMPLEEARMTFMQLPGVGPKTADVVLLFCAGRPTIPVDTHVNRVSKRLDLAPRNGNYEGVRQSLQALYSQNDYLSVHVLLISLGRNYCTSRNPLCRECPVERFCQSKRDFAHRD